MCVELQRHAADVITLLLPRFIDGIVALRNAHQLHTQTLSEDALLDQLLARLSTISRAIA
jgi:hypothetical protein